MNVSKIVVIVLLLYGCGPQNHPSVVSRDSTAQNKDTLSVKSSSPPDSMLITVMLPKDIRKYEQAMTDYTNDGGVDPSAEWTFAPAELGVPYTTDTLKASAAAAAKVLSVPGDSVVYFRVKDKTAYVLLEMDVNGWAGVTYTIRKVHPIVEHTLLYFPGIDKVAFAYAPEDTRRSVSSQ